MFDSNDEQKFDYIITNPPWGSKFSKQQKDLLVKKYPVLKTTESFSIILYNSINKLFRDGKLIFFLPHSFLNVSTHSNIRKYLSDGKKSLAIRLLGNAFKGVMSEAICIKISNQNSNEILVLSEDQNPTLIQYSSLQKPDYIISATASNADFDLIKKVYDKKHLLLKDNAKFALGIVTGNNDKHLLQNPSGESEPIFRGKDISPFCFNSPELFIEFNPTIYQQVAPVELYRQKKIAYRFISDKLVCVLDSENKLLLNSANLFIPTLDYPFETIVILFNSKLYTFIYRKMYHSKKVLRSHIESLPLPLLSDSEHQSLKILHDKYKAGNINIPELNQSVYLLFSLDAKEIDIIEKDM